MNWEEFPKDVIGTMTELGHFSPTVDEKTAEVKGYTYDCDEGGVSKTYWNSTDLRRISDHLLIVADWLEARAEKAGNP